MSLLNKVEHIHFIGIGGYGMSALALIMLKKGYRVSGSDVSASALTASLAEAGAAIMIGHQAQNIAAPDLVIYSTAIAPTNPELEAAARSGIPLWHRSELLAALLNNAYGIAIAGAHGKTTTTAMIAILLEAADLDPTALVGGVVPVFGSNARIGESRYLVAEADESDGSFTRYYPKMALVTGIEADHLEHYANDYSRLKEAYSEFLSHLPPEKGVAVICADDPALVGLSREISCGKIYYSADSCRGIKQGEEVKGGWLPNPRQPDRTGGGAGPSLITGINNSSQHGQVPDYYADDIQLKPDSSAFTLRQRGKTILHEVILSVPGLHNVSNAVGALALVDQLVPDLASCIPALKKFKGAGRRFEKIGEARAITVIDDYAHHPTEVKATLETARLAAKRVLCLFQPHRYSRITNLFNDFATAFSAADRLYLHEIYPAGEEPLAGITGEALATAIKRESGKPVFFNADITALENQVATDARPGDLIITMGAGDITYSAPRILQLLIKSFKM